MMNGTCFNDMSDAQIKTNQLMQVEDMKRAVSEITLQEQVEGINQNLAPTFRFGNEFVFGDFSQTPGGHDVYDDFPSFDGSNPRIWTMECENYLQIQPYISDVKRIDLAIWNFEGKAFSWVSELLINEIFAMTWEQFCEVVCTRFEMLKVSKDEDALEIEVEKNIDKTESLAILNGLEISFSGLKKKRIKMAHAHLNKENEIVDEELDDTIEEKNVLIFDLGGETMAYGAAVQAVSDGLKKKKHEELGTVLNWDPGDSIVVAHVFLNLESDGHLYLSDRRSIRFPSFCCKFLVQKGLSLAPEASDSTEVQLVVCITRLVAQKGLHLITNAIRHVGTYCGQMIILGTASDARDGSEFEGLVQVHNQSSNIRIHLMYSEELSHILYAAADIVLVTSIYAPCGLLGNLLNESSQSQALEVLGSVNVTLLPPPSPPIYFTGYKLPPGNPFEHFTLPLPPADIKRTSPRPCPVCYMPLEDTTAMPNASSVFHVIRDLAYIHEDSLSKSEFGGSAFGGYPSLRQSSNSYIVRESMSFHCGFVRGVKPGRATYFGIHDSDLLEMENCRGVVVASAILGAFDLIRQSKNISENTRKTLCFHMFLDQETTYLLRNSSELGSDKKIALWRIKVVHNLPYSDSRLNGKISKLLLHRLFPSARSSLWSDAKLELVVDPFQILERFLWRKNASFAISRHYKRFDVFIEAGANKVAGKYDNASIDFQIEFYKEEVLTPYSTGKLPIPSDVPQRCVIMRKHISITNFSVVAGLCAPGLGVDCGSTLRNIMRVLFQGLSLAPQMVDEAKKGSIFIEEGYKVQPHCRVPRHDIVHAVKLVSRERLLTFGEAVHKNSFVSSFIKPVPGATSGYASEVIFIDGTFIDGSTSELSCDGSLREPFLVYCHGGIIGTHLKKNVNLKPVFDIQKEDLRKVTSLVCNLTNQLESASMKYEMIEAKISKTDFLMDNIMACKTDLLILVCLVVLRKTHTSDGLKCILCTFSFLDPRGRGPSSGGGIVMYQAGRMEKKEE